MAPRIHANLVASPSFFGLRMLLLFLSIADLANALGPRPPNVLAVTWSAQAMRLLVAWGYWTDRQPGRVRIDSRSIAPGFSGVQCRSPDVCSAKDI